MLSDPNFNPHFSLSMENMAAALASSAVSTSDQSRKIKSPERQLAIDRIYKDNVLKELTLERKKVKSITDERDKLLNALKTSEECIEA